MDDRQPKNRQALAEAVRDRMFSEDAASRGLGMRVEAVWVEDHRLAPTMTSIEFWRPTGEPDAPYESFREHV